MQGRFYEIKLSGAAERIKQHFSSFQPPASNCAYLFYHTLAPDEKDTYSFIRVTIEGDNTSNTYEFDTTELAQVEQAMALADQTMGYMRSADYGAFLAKGSSQVATKQQWQQAKAEFAALDQRCGLVKDFRLQSFELIDHNLASGAKRFVGLTGVLVREKQNTAFNLVLDPAASSQSDYLYGFNLAK